MKRFEYYFDYSPDMYNYIMSSRILRNRDKKILQDLVDGKNIREIAIDNGCCERTICSRRKDIFEKTRQFM